MVHLFGQFVSNLVYIWFHNLRYIDQYHMLNYCCVVYMYVGMNVIMHHIPRLCPEGALTSPVTRLGIILNSH